MKKPHWFRLVDLFAVGGGGFVTLALLVYALIIGAEGPGVAQGLALLGTVCVAFFIGWGIVAYKRKKWLDTFRWIPTFNLMIQQNGYLLPADEEVDNVVRNLINVWSPLHPMVSVPGILRDDINWVYFRKDLDETPMNPAHQKVNGFSIPGTHIIEVDFDEKLQTLQSTAFEHELGHLIHGLATGKWDQTEHHEFMLKHNLK